MALGTVYMLRPKHQLTTFILKVAPLDRLLRLPMF